MSTLRARILSTALVSSLGVAVLAMVPWPSWAGLPSMAQGNVATIAAPPALAAVVPLPDPEPRFHDVKHTIRKGQALGSILPDYGVHQVDAVVDAAEPWVDLTSIWAGKELLFTLDRDADDSAVSLRYVLDEDRTLVVDLSGDSPKADVEEVVYARMAGQRVLTVQGSLWQSAVDAGLRPADIVRIAHVFRFDVDFNTELQAGARFSVIGEDLYSGGEYVKMGALQAVRLENKGEVFTAIHFVHADGRDGWYHPDGTAAKKPFLRSPLDFARVTSNFNGGRYHPVLKKKRKHLGTDFGCPTGTPVKATGSGVVTMAKKNGGHGNHLVIKHEGGRVTKYSHLSSFKVKKGQKVEQGQVVALSGNTGMSTGPHLHYELHLSGKAVDAMKVELPTTDTMPSAERAAFNAQRDTLVAQLDAMDPDGEAAAPAMVDGE